MWRNHSARFRQNATGQPPVSHFQSRLPSSTDVPDYIVQNQPGSDLVLAGCVRFWPNGSGPEARLCARITDPVRFWPNASRADPDRMRIGFDMFTGILQLHRGTGLFYTTNAQGYWSLLYYNCTGVLVSSILQLHGGTGLFYTTTSRGYWSLLYYNCKGVLVSSILQLQGGIVLFNTITAWGGIS